MEGAAPRRVTAIEAACAASSMACGMSAPHSSEARKKAGKRVARRGGVHGARRIRRLPHGLRAVRIHRALLAQRQHGRRAREFFAQRMQKRLHVRAVLPGELRRFHAVEQEQVDAFQREVQHARFHRRGVERDVHAPRMRLPHDVRQLVDLVLQQQPVARAEMLQCFVHLCFGDRAVRAAVQQDAVIPLAVVLDDGAAGAFVLRDAHIFRVHACGLQFFQQEAAVFAGRARHPGLRARARQRYGLVQPLAAAEHLQGFRRKRLALADKVVDPVGIVNVERTKA